MRRIVTGIENNACGEKYKEKECVGGGSEETTHLGRHVVSRCSLKCWPIQLFYFAAARSDHSEKKIKTQQSVWFQILSEKGGMFL